MIIRKDRTPHPTGFMFASDAGDIWMFAGLLGFVEDLDGASAGCDHCAVSKRDPLVGVLGQ